MPAPVLSVVAAADAGARVHTHRTTALTTVECSRAQICLATLCQPADMLALVHQHQYGDQNVLDVMYGNIMLTGRHVRYNLSARRNVLICLGRHVLPPIG